MLPREIRDLIYWYCVVANGAIDPYQNMEQHKIVSLCLRKPSLSLLKVDRQVGEEAKAVIFGSNRWRLYYQSEYIVASKPWKKFKKATTFWKTHIKSFRHVVTGLDFCEEERVLLTSPDGTLNTHMAHERTLNEDDMYRDLLRQLILSRDWKKKLLEQMNLKSFVFNLDHSICRDSCRRWDVVCFVCNEVSMLREHWKTTRVIVKGSGREEACA